MPDFLAGHILILSRADRGPTAGCSLLRHGFRYNLAQDWARCVTQLMSDSPPDAWIISGELVSQSSVSLVESLHNQQLLVPSCLLLEGPSSPETAAAAMQLSKFGVEPLIAAEDLPKVIREAIDSHFPTTLPNICGNG
jgi:hypothetical protein